MDANADPTDLDLARHIAGECDAAETRALESRLAESAGLRARVAQLRLLVGAEPPAAEWNVDAMWSAFSAQTDANASRIRSKRIRASRHLITETPWITIGVAAAMLFMAVGVARLVPRHAVVAPAPSVVEEPTHYSTARGQYATIQLTDGSRVTLAPQSRLTIPAAFALGSREISLEGEAIFEVRHDAVHPFRVHANGARIEDIGTRFDLRAYASDSSVTVAVAEGSVALGRDRRDSTAHVEGLVLHRGELGSLDKAGRASTAKPVRITAYLSWANGRLTFVSRPLPEVLASIGRWYDLDIRVPDPALASRLVTAEFSTQSPSEMIDALATAMNASVERHDRVVTLRAR